MPPRTRSSKPLKCSKENITASDKTKIKSVSKVTKQRKALADRTNSASDDNSSSKVTKKVIKENVKNQIKNDKLERKERPRRDRKLPSKYQQSEVLLNLSHNKNKDAEKYSPDKNDCSISPFKTPQQVIDNSLIGNRPRRMCHLPSRFDESISPNKFVPVGCHASTPIVQNKNVTSKNKPKPATIDNKKPTSVKLTKKQPLVSKKNLQFEPKVVLKKLSPQKRTLNTSTTKANNVTTNTPKKRLLTEKNVSNSSEETNNNKNTGKKLLTANFSFRLLEDKKSKASKRTSSHLDVYEFTYDPSEEPAQKKKRKRVVKKKPPKPKMVYLKTNYDQNISKALATLKNAVTKKPVLVEAEVNTANLKDVVNSNERVVSNVPPIISKQSENQIMSSVPKEPVSLTAKNQAHFQQEHNMSTRVEDIVADFEPIMDDIDYSPVNSPNRPASPVPNTERYSNIEPSVHNNDPLNLRDNLSFFGEPPVASSSMNTSTRQPYASPWRVQFEQLPIKWHVNSYVKANMTPAVESSYFNFEDSKNKRKHVYTNLVPESNDDVPQIVENNHQNLKQTSILSFIKGVIERSAKKKRAKSVTPNKNATIGNVSKTTDTNNPKTTREETSNYWTPEKNKNDSVPNNESNEEEDQNQNSNQENEVNMPEKENNKDGTFFGFDESEDQENVSPVKIDKKKVRALRPRGRAVLQEINAQPKPTRAKIPLAAKLAPSSEVINKVYENMKSAADAPVFPDKNADPCIETTNVDQSAEQDLNDDQQSVHLFEDIEVVHHLKQSRKSYGKAKRVAFQQTATVDSVFQVNAARDSGSSDEDDLADLTFTMPNMEQKSKPKKKVKKKKQQSKKEKAEMEAWAAQFNSMCEDIEEFPLVVE